MKTTAYCRICGHEPDTPTNTTRKYWDPDEGWIIGALCPSCVDEFGGVRPSPDDFAYENPYGDDVLQTDEDIEFFF